MPILGGQIGDLEVVDLRERPVVEDELDLGTDQLPQGVQRLGPASDDLQGLAAEVVDDPVEQRDQDG